MFFNQVSEFSANICTTKNVEWWIEPNYILSAPRIIIVLVLPVMFLMSNNFLSDIISKAELMLIASFMKSLLKNTLL